MSRAVATIGMFDGVHLGHRDLLRHLRQESEQSGSRSLVITFSNHPLSLIRPEIAPKLITTPEEKRNLLFSEGVDTVAILEFTPRLRAMTAHEYICSLKYEYDVETIILGFNNRFGSDTGLTFEDYVEIGKREGIKVIREPEYLVDGIKVNSTIVRNHIASGEIEMANRLLGGDFSLTGTVVYGKQLGRTIGYPTANVEVMNEDKIIPGRGVYACYATMNKGVRYPAMVNIGHRPTVDGKNGLLSIEAHIIGVADKLYGKRITLSFCHFLRHEQKFSSLDELKRQLEKDKIETIGKFFDVENRE